MSDAEMSPKWRNPLFLWSAKGAIEELPTIPFRSHQEIWRKTRESRTELFPVGRLRYYYKWPGHGSATWNRLRYWPTRRRVLRGGGHGCFLHGIPFDELWGAVVAAASDRSRRRLDLRRNHRAAGDAP